MIFSQLFERPERERPIGAFGDDALAAELTGVLEHQLAIAVHVVVVEDVITPFTEQFAKASFVDAPEDKTCLAGTDLNARREAREENPQTDNRARAHARRGGGADRRPILDEALRHVVVANAPGRPAAFGKVAQCGPQTRA